MKENKVSMIIPHRPKFIKILAAYFLDFILIMITFTGFLYLFSLIFNYNGLMNSYNQALKDYQVMILDESNNYVYCDETLESCKLALTNLYSDETFINNFTSLKRFLYFAPTIALAISFLIYDFIIPLFFKNYTTIGMKFLNIALISNNGIKIKKIQLFIRMLFGHVVVDGIIPLIGIESIFFNDEANFSGFIYLIIVIIANIITFFLTNKKALIANAIASCKLCDANEQIFFESEEELNSYKAKEALILSKNKTHEHR